MNSVEKQIVQYIDEHQNEFIIYLQDLIKIPSVTGNEKKVQEFIKKKIETLGFKTKLVEPDIKKMFEKFPEVAQIPSIGEEGLDMPLMTEDKFTYEQLMASPYNRLKSYKNRPNLTGFLKGNGGGRSIILNGHIDTVPVGDLSKWHHDPFGAEIKDGKIFGRGAVDMKGGVAAMTSAVETLKALNLPISGDIEFQTVVNEEHAGGGALGLVADGCKADAAIVTEPAGFGANVILDGSGGGVYWEVIVSGKEAHANSRWKDNTTFGISAIEKAALIVDSLMALEKKLNKDRIMMSLCVGKIIGGTYATATAAECKINGVAYFSPDLGVGKEGIIKVKKYLKDAVHNIDDSWLKSNPPILRFQHYDDAYMLGKGNRDILETAMNSVVDVMGEKAVVSQLGGGCDARHLGNQAGIPTIVYGPGDCAVAHSADEYVGLEDFINSIKVIAISVYRWCR